jgi:putative SOS response-associated peptidase YedK
MCGRYKLDISWREINALYGVTNMPPDDDPENRPRYNIAPTTRVPVITSANGTRALELMRWGLIPSWSKDAKPPYATFNARADGLTTKPAFRGAWKAGRRCAIVTSGFYEWRKSDKQPFCIGLGNKQPMLMAGLWEEWRPKGSEPIKSCTIITTEANAFMAPLHDRMPVILGDEDLPAWLGETPLADPASLLKQFPGERMTMWPVAKAVGNVRSQGAELAEPIAL